APRARAHDLIAGRPQRQREVRKHRLPWRRAHRAPGRDPPRRSPDRKAAGQRGVREDWPHRRHGLRGAPDGVEQPGRRTGRRHRVDDGTEGSLAMVEQRYFEDVDPGDEIEEPVDVSTDAVVRYLSMPGNRQGQIANRFTDAER